MKQQNKQKILENLCGMDEKNAQEKKERKREKKVEEKIQKGKQTNFIVCENCQERKPI